jgi:diguanylate cyclase (GGDEF)-like protein
MGERKFVSNATASAGRGDPLFTSYVALANGLVGDLTGIVLLDGSLKPRGQTGELNAAAVSAWAGTLRWTDLHERAPAAHGFGPLHWWAVIAIQQSDGTLLGAFCVSRRVAAPPTQPSRFADELAARLKPLLDCVHRDLAASRSKRAKVKELTERTAELEWLFQVTSNLNGAVDDQRIIEELLKAATTRLDAALGIICIPDKRMLVMHEGDRKASPTLREAWTQMRQHLITWVQRQNRPLVVNGAGTGGNSLVRCKFLCVPIVRDTGRVIGALVFYNPPDARDFSGRQVFLARHIGRQAASIVEAQFDLMTGLYTRSGLDQMYQPVDDPLDYSESSVIYLDIDHMHVANELHGFELGNELIVRVADVLSTPLLPDDALAGRISGDRFAVILPKATAAEAVKIAERLQAAVSQLRIGPSQEVFDISISCGVSGLVAMPEGLARAIAAAELACKTAKGRGRNRIEVYACEDGSMMRRHRDALAVGQLRSALKADRLLLYAQRIVPLRNPSLPGGYEILLRLQEVDGSLVAPGPLIEAAQRYQILPSVDRWVVQRALQMLGPYRSMLRTRALGMSINVSGQSIGDETFIQQFIQLLKQANLPRDCVSVELTEQAAIKNLANAKQMVARMSALGCTVALDDFGTGANSLTYLKALQVSRVKIDGSFVRDILSDRNSQATVRAVVELAKRLGIPTVAEFVETDEIASEVRRLGVDYGQGYAFGKPEPLSGLLEDLARDESQRLHRLFLET